MNGDPCTKDVWWSAITASSADSTLAGVLAGLLIAAAAALLVQWYEGSDPHTIARARHWRPRDPAVTVLTAMFA